MKTITSTYENKLKDPRWQQKRLRILERDLWRCQFCSDETSTLIVHHKRYLPSLEPWEYPDKLLVTLCEFCHNKETTDRRQYEQRLLEILRESFSTNDLQGITNTAEDWRFSLPSELVAIEVSWLLTSPSAQCSLINKYFSYLRAKDKSNAKR